MIIGYSGQNLALGGARFRFEYTVTAGTFQVGERITGGTSSAEARIERVDTTNYIVLAIARTGQFVAGETITGATSGATGTIDANTLTEYTSPRSKVLSTTAAAASGLIEDIQNYQVGNTVSWTVNTTTDIEIDRGASWSAGTRTIDDPKAVLISGFSDSSYNYLANTTNMSSVTVYMDDNASFTSPTQIGAITAGSPTYGPKTFGYPQLYIPLTVATTERYLRIRFTSSASATITIGNIWIGDVVDTVADEGWSFRGLSITSIDRSERAQTLGGGWSINTRAPVRKLELEAVFNYKSHMRLSDLFDAHQSAYNDRGSPLMICFDPDNDAIAVTGSHWSSGLWLIDPSIATADTGAYAGGSFFVPSIPLRFTEWRG